MSNGRADPDRELRLLGELCRSLARLGLGVQIRDARPGLTVTRSRDAAEGSTAYVTLSPSGTRFVWRRVDDNHPASDIDGAAQRIAVFVGEQAPGAGVQGAGS
jgi:hypothetical protein